MILNQPFWAMIDPTGKEIVWDWEAPLTSELKSVLVGDLKRISDRAKRAATAKELPPIDRDLAYWKAVTIQKVTIQKVTILPCDCKQPPSLHPIRCARGLCEKCNTLTNWTVEIGGRRAYWCGCGN